MCGFPFFFFLIIFSKDHENEYIIKLDGVSSCSSTSQQSSSKYLKKGKIVEVSFKARFSLTSRELRQICFLLCYL